MSDAPSPPTCAPEPDVPMTSPSSPAFSAAPALSPSPLRRTLLKEFRTRGLLAAPAARQLSESCLAAFRAGTLPIVTPLPTPPSTPPSTPSATPPSSARPSRRLSHSSSDAASEDLDNLLCTDVDSLCRNLDAVLRLPDSARPRHPPSLPRSKNDGPPRRRALREVTTPALALNVAAPGLKGQATWLGNGEHSFAAAREGAAQRLMKYLDREVLGAQLVGAGGKARVSVAWSPRLTKTAGITRMKRLPGGQRTAEIELSVKVVDEPGRLYNTLAHELCHAAAWIVDESAKPPHGDVFKRWAQRFASWDAELVITRCHDYEIRYKFQYVCKECGHAYGRHSRSIDTTKKVCGRCRGTLECERA